VPADNVTVGEVLNEYNIPLTGMIEQDGTKYLYVCLFGELELLNIWAYSPIVSAEEIDRLASMTGEELTDVINQALTDRSLVVALASDYKLVDWLSIDAGLEGSLRIARRFLDRMRARVEATKRDVEGLEHQRELACAIS
jgi:hypothetical protein